MSNNDLNISAQATTPVQSATAQLLYPDLNISTPAHSLRKSETDYIRTLNPETKRAREKFLESWKKAIAIERGYRDEANQAPQTRAQIKADRKQISKETQTALKVYTREY